MVKTVMIVDDAEDIVGLVKKILEDLKAKAEYVKWFNDKRKEKYGIIARKIEGKNDLRKEGFFAYDLDDWK